MMTASAANPSSSRVMAATGSSVEAEVEGAQFVAGSGKGGDQEGEADGVDRVGERSRLAEINSSFMALPPKPASAPAAGRSPPQPVLDVAGKVGQGMDRGSPCHRPAVGVENDGAEFEGRRFISPDRRPDRQTFVEARRPQGTFSSRVTTAEIARLGQLVGGQAEPGSQLVASYLHSRRHSGRARRPGRSRPR